MFYCPNPVGAAIATPASQLRSPLKFEENTKLIFKNRISREKNLIKPGFVPFDMIRVIDTLLYF